MKIILTLIFSLFCINASGVSWGDSQTFIKIKTGKKEFTYMDISKMPIVYDGDEMIAYLGYHVPSKDHTGKYKAIFISIKSFHFDDESQYEEWIKSVRPYKKCLGNSGLAKCK